MHIKTLAASSYLKPEDRFHFSRQHLSGRLPGPVHNHDYFEVFWVKGGRPLHCVNGTSTKLEPRQVTFIRPSDTHSLDSEGAENCLIANLVVPIETAAHLVSRYVGEFTGRFFWSQSNSPETLTLSHAQFDMFDQMESLLEDNPRSLASLDAFLLSMLSQLGPAIAPGAVGVPDWLSAALRKAKQPETFREGASAFVEACGRSHEHVCRQTKGLLGMTPSEIITNSRMEYAGRALRHTSRCTSDIAEECGIGNESHFYKLFRQYFKMTPKEYRRMNRSNPIQP